MTSAQCGACFSSHFQTRVHSAYLWYVPLELLSIQFRLSDNFFTTELVNSRSHILDGLNASNFLATVYLKRLAVPKQKI